MFKDWTTYEKIITVLYLLSGILFWVLIYGKCH